MQSTNPMDPRALSSKGRAELSEGRSDESLYELVGDLLKPSVSPHAVVVDVGCGRGMLWPRVAAIQPRYIGMDVVAYQDFPAECEFVEADLNAQWPLNSNYADAMVSIETIEHMENPRAFVREIARVAKPGGLVVISTPNQLSLLSKLCLVLKNEFVQFQERPGLYPAHITALLETDLRRIALECGLREPLANYSGHGRIPFTERSYPRFVSRMFPRAFSDNIFLVARKPPADYGIACTFTKSSSAAVRPLAETLSDPGR
ncbi:MAG: methyltransferase domain-containing protein [Candidatus Binatus sp.]